MGDSQPTQQRIRKISNRVTVIDLELKKILCQRARGWFTGIDLCHSDSSNIFYCNNLCTYYKIIPPEHFLCNVAATGLSLFAREHAKEFAFKSDCFFDFYK